MIHGCGSKRSSKLGCVRIDMVKRSTHQHGPSLLSELVDAVKLECHLH